MSSSSAARLSSSLTILSDQIQALPHAKKFSDMWGVQALPLDKDDLAYMARLLSKKIESVSWEASEKNDTVFDDLTPKVEAATQIFVPQLFANFQASNGLTAFLYSVDVQIEAQVDPSQIRSVLSLPAALHKYVTAARARLQTATSTIDGIEDKIRSINSAYDAADRLLITQDDISQVLREIEISKLESAKLDAATRNTAEEVEKLKTKLLLVNQEAEAVLSKVETAYRAATSQGLAQAFSIKAKSLNDSIRIWVAALILSLIAATLLGHGRFPEILRAVTLTPNWGLVLLNVILGILSVAPPVWIAWVATKQIGQRFRLAEDYGYKAALSAAYEGYRNEASKIDPIFEAQLFATALGRLDEIPLRLIESEVHGSPWHEFLTSDEFKNASKQFPDLKDRIIGILKPRSNTKVDNTDDNPQGGS